MKKGDIVAVGKYSYQITNTAKKTAAFAGLADENVKKVSIAASVKINNTAYRITSVKANALKGKKENHQRNDWQKCCHNRCKSILRMQKSEKDHCENNHFKESRKTGI